MIYKRKPSCSHPYAKATGDKEFPVCVCTDCGTVVRREDYEVGVYLNCQPKSKGVSDERNEKFGSQCGN